MEDPGFSYFLRVASELTFEVQKEHVDFMSFLEEVDGLFVKWIPGAGKTKPGTSAILILNAHASFRAAIFLAMSGQLLPVFMALRGTIESVLYANTMVGNPALEKVWLERDNSEEARQICRSAFAIRKCFDAITTSFGREGSGLDIHHP